MLRERLRPPSIRRPTTSSKFSNFSCTFHPFPRAFCHMPQKATSFHVLIPGSLERPCRKHEKRFARHGATFSLVSFREFSTIQDKRRLAESKSGLWLLWIKYWLLSLIWADGTIPPTSAPFCPPGRPCSSGNLQRFQSVFPPLSSRHRGRAARAPRFIRFPPAIQ